MSENLLMDNSHSQELYQLLLTSRFHNPLKKYEILDIFKKQILRSAFL